MPETPILLYGLLALALAISLVTDLWRQLIYNWVTFPTVGLALAIRFFFEGAAHRESVGAFVGAGWGRVMGGWGLASGLVGLGAGFGIFLVPYLFGGGVKEGDVKLTGAVGAAVGFPAILVFIALVGGLEAVLYLVWKGKFFRTVGRIGRLVGHKLRLVKDNPKLEGDLIPYGVAIALGTAWGTAWMLYTASA